MRKRKENKNDKLILFGACLLIVAFLSWIISASTYQSGQLVDIGMYRAGLYDIIAVIFSVVRSDWGFSRYLAASDILPINRSSW